MEKELLIFSDSQYEIFTNEEVNGVERAKHFLEIAVGSLNDFIGHNGLSKEEGLARLESVKATFDELYNETKEQLK